MIATKRLRREESSSKENEIDSGTPVSILTGSKMNYESSEAQAIRERLARTGRFTPKNARS